MEKVIGDWRQPRVFCRKCGEIVYCEFPSMRPERAKRKLKGIHEQTGCDGEIEYVAGIA